MAPSISIRDSIRFLPKPPTEPTSTVVLTSPESRFVDVRIFRSGTPWEFESREDILPATRIDWAFAGTSTTTPIPSLTTDATGKIAHTKWTHWVDSRHADAGAVSDEGDMFALADGRTLERGCMVDPETGVEGAYEEVWRDERIVWTDRDVVGKGREEAAGATRGGEREADAPRCVVLVLADEGREARGMVMRLGQFCQGFLRVGEHVTVERWVWKAEKGWRRQVSVGDFFLPCGVVCEGKVGGVGGKVEYGEFEWVVVEDGEV